MVLFLTIIHGIADLISVLFRHSNEIQQTNWDFGKFTARNTVVSTNFLTETQSNISFTEVC